MKYDPVQEFEDIDEFNDMIELRQRPVRTSGYSRLSTEDEIDDVPELNTEHLRQHIPKSSPPTCTFPAFQIITYLL
jgi:hypothetical protein